MDAARELAALKDKVAAVVKLHPRVQNPRHGCCAKPKLCNGHLDECGGREHALDRPSWPCPTLRALGIHDDLDVRAYERHANQTGVTRG